AQDAGPRRSAGSADAHYAGRVVGRARGDPRESDERAGGSDRGADGPVPGALEVCAISSPERCHSVPKGALAPNAVVEGARAVDADAADIVAPHAIAAGVAVGSVDGSSARDACEDPEILTGRQRDRRGPVVV